MLCVLSAKVAINYRIYRAKVAINYSRDSFKAISKYDLPSMMSEV
jgi:hypothetical protein